MPFKREGIFPRKSQQKVRGASMDKINGWGEGGETVKLATSDRQAKWREQMRKTPSRRKHLFPLNAAIFRVLKIQKKKKIKQWKIELTSHSLL